MFERLCVLPYNVMRLLDTKDRAMFAMAQKRMYNTFCPTFIFEKHRNSEENSQQNQVVQFWQEFNEFRFQDNFFLPLIEKYNEANAIYKYVNIHDTHDTSYLMHKLAVDGRKEDTFAFVCLLKLIPDVNKQSKNSHTTFLHSAVLGGDLFFVNALIGAKADPNIADKDGNTPLHLSINKDPELLQILINANANPFIINSDKDTPMNIAMSFERWAHVQALANHEEEYRQRPSSYVIRTESKPVARKLEFQ